MLQAVINITATDSDNDVVAISMRPTGALDGSQYFLMLPFGTVLLRRSLIGRAGDVYIFVVTVGTDALLFCTLSV